jgi:plasmid maintenance system antidote protein VapI
VPKTPPRKAARHTLADQLREVIESRGLSSYGLARDSGVSAAVISRFRAKERDITLETADRMAEVLGVRLVEVAKAKGRRKVEVP